MSVGSQLLLKRGAKNSAKSLNIWTITGLAIFGLVTILMVYALQAIPLKTVIALNALTFVIMPWAAKIFLNEESTKLQMTSSLVIVTGIVVFSCGG